LPPPAGVNVYELTAQGRELEPVLFALARFGWRYMSGAPYVDPGGPRGLVMVLRLVLPQQVASGPPARIALRVADDDIGVTVSEQGAVAVTLGAPPSPTATLEMAYQTAFGLVGGKLTVRHGIRQGLIKATGAAAALPVLEALLRQRAFPPQGQPATTGG
jgi:hypothetical protein